MPFLFLGCILGVSVGVFLFSCLEIYVEDVRWGISSVFRICWSDPVVASCIFFFFFFFFGIFLEGPSCGLLYFSGYFWSDPVVAS